MSKEELAKRYQEIVLKTNGGADDYVVALCQIANLISEAGKEIEEQTKQLAELKVELEEYKTHENHSCNSIDEMIKQCDECELCECMGCEHSNTCVEQIKQLKAENERLKTCKCCECQSENEFYLKQTISDLEQQLKEKDEEIEKLKQQLEAQKTITEMVNEESKLNFYRYIDVLSKNEKLDEQLKSNTKQVCEKIREEYHKFDSNDDFDWQGFEEFLAQIEKGEDDEN